MTKKQQSNREGKKPTESLSWLVYTQIKIVDPGTRKIVPINTPGEILAKGYGTMQGYWNQQEKTNEIITQDGWLHTGFPF